MQTLKIVRFVVRTPSSSRINSFEFRYEVDRVLVSTLRTFYKSEVKLLFPMATREVRNLDGCAAVKDGLCRKLCNAGP